MLLATDNAHEAEAITCASRRQDELREGLIRAIFRASAIGMVAQTALLDGDVEAALDHLRAYWIATRAVIAPMASELAALDRARAVQ